VHDGERAVLNGRRREHDRPIFPAALTSNVTEMRTQWTSVVGFINHVGRPDAVRLTTLWPPDLPIVTPYWCIETPSTSTIPSSFKTAPLRVNNANPASGLPVDPNATVDWRLLKGNEIHGVGKLAPQFPQLEIHDSIRIHHGFGTQLS